MLVFGFGERGDLGDDGSTTALDHEYLGQEGAVEELARGKIRDRGSAVINSANPGLSDTFRPL